MPARLPIRLKRAYEPPEASDGVRVLVERLWPRGVAKDAARIDLWAKGTAPSTELRRWFGHDPAKWDEFRRRYAAELERAPDALERLEALARAGPVTFVYGSREERHNSATALRELLEERG